MDAPAAPAAAANQSPVSRSRQKSAKRQQSTSMKQESVQDCSQPAAAAAVSTRLISTRNLPRGPHLLLVVAFLQALCKCELALGQQSAAQQHLPIQQQQQQQPQQQMISTAQSNGKLLLPQPPRQQAMQGEQQGAQALLQPGLGPSQGPGVDLVALNWRRFELEHRHRSGHDTTGQDVRRAELIESELAAIPERILEQLPDELGRQVVESLQADRNFLTAQAPTSGAGAPSATEDPDGASIERLTKSCLTIQASSLTPEQLNVTFHLYTRRNPSQSFIVRPQASRAELLQAPSPFNPSQPIKWITHGFHTNLDKSEWMLEAKDKILAGEEANVFLTDWRRGASPALAFYPKAAANAHVVARMIVKILRRLRADINLARVHLIGHSLGAHIMGFVGSAFTEEFLRKQQQVLWAAGAKSGAEPAAGLTAESVDNQLIGRITACDPALPCFGPSSQAPNSGKMSGLLTVEQANGAKGFKRPASGLDRFGAHQRFGRQMAAAGAPLPLPLPLPLQQQKQQQQQQQQQQQAALNILAEDWTPAMWTHLRPDSAVLVEVMHTNPGVMGYAEPLGDFDFYPNGSERQPGCGAANGSSSAPAAGEDGLGEGMGASAPVVKSTSRQLLAPSSSSGEQRRHGELRPPRRAANTIGKRQFGLVGSVMQLVAERNQQQISAATGEAAAAALDNYAGLTKTLGQFIKPIRDFFQAYTCSHHRAVDYMVESMYYEQLEPKRRLERERVCQMVGYRCADYQSFKRGHCFLCRNEFECRSFAMFGQAATKSSFASAGASERFQLAQQPLAASFARDDLAPLANRAQPNANVARQQAQPLEGTLLRQKRILPTLSQYKYQNYKPAQRSRYYFDTKPSASYCLHHYHLLIKYRWLRIRDSVAVDRIRLSGTVGDLLVVPAQPQEQRHKPPKHQQRLTFDKFTHHSYTMLLTSADFLGQLESLALYGAEGDRLKSRYIEHIEITYMSNIDPLVRAVNSARMCRANQDIAPPGQRQLQLNSQLARMMGIAELGDDPGRRWTTGMDLFVRCSQETLLVR